jgi:multimeric flavodoxin WrbA
MKVTILNGNPSPENAAFDGYLRGLVDALKAGQHVVTLLPLRDMDIKYCTSCWGCWVKTPGECVAKDDSAEVCRAVINADLVLHASPVIMGFYSALLKKTTDKLIPLIHPYAAVDQGEAHHRARYRRYPLLGLLLQKGDDDEDIAIIPQIYSRTALNFKSTVALAKLTSDPIEEVAREIDRL